MTWLTFLSICGIRCCADNMLSYCWKPGQHKHFQKPPLHLLAPFHQLHWVPLMCRIMKCSNERATALILNKYKTHSHAAHCITVKQIVPDWASHMSVMLSQHDIHLPSPTQLATLFSPFLPPLSPPPLLCRRACSHITPSAHSCGASAIYRF